MICRSLHERDNVAMINMADSLRMLVAALKMVEDLHCYWQSKILYAVEIPDKWG